MSLLAYVISVGTGRGSATQLETVLQHTWWLILGLMIPYLACRALVWHQLLLELGIALPWRPLLMAFSVREMTKNLPAGVELQSTVVREAR